MSLCERLLCEFERRISEAKWILAHQRLTQDCRSLWENSMMRDEEAERSLMHLLKEKLPLRTFGSGSIFQLAHAPNDEKSEQLR